MAYNVQCLHVDNVRASDVERMVSSTVSGISQCPVLCCDQLLNLCCPPLPPPVQLTQGAQPVFTTR